MPPFWKETHPKWYAISESVTRKEEHKAEQQRSQSRLLRLQNELKPPEYAGKKGIPMKLRGGSAPLEAGGDDNLSAHNIAQHMGDSAQNVEDNQAPAPDGTTTPRDDHGNPSHRALALLSSIAVNTRGSRSSTILNTADSANELGNVPHPVKTTQTTIQRAGTQNQEDEITEAPPMVSNEDVEGSDVEVQTQQPKADHDAPNEPIQGPPGNSGRVAGGEGAAQDAVVLMPLDMDFGNLDDQLGVNQPQAQANLAPPLQQSWCARKKARLARCFRRSNGAPNNQSCCCCSYRYCLSDCWELVICKPILWCGSQIWGVYKYIEHGRCQRCNSGCCCFYS